MSEKSIAGDPLRIVVLGTALRSAGGLSVGRNMVEAVVRVAPDNEYLFFVPGDVGYEEICARAPHSETQFTKPTSELSRLWYDWVRLPKIVAKFQPDAILGITALGLLNPGCPQAVLVDQPQLIYSDRHSGPRTVRDRLRHAYLRWHFRRQLAHTQLVLCRTEDTARRLREQYEFDGKPLVIGSSVSTSFLVAPGSQDMPETLKKYGEKLKLLYVTRYYPHKNIEGIVDLFDSYRDELSNVVVFLTITPDQHKNVATILNRIEKLGLDNQIVNLGLVPHEEIAAYFHGCDAKFMPTFLETHSVPYMEAISVGLPILTSDIDFAHASCGDAALYFDPWSTESMRDAILRFENEPALRTELTQRSKGRFGETHQSWDDIASNVLSELRIVVESAASES